MQEAFYNLYTDGASRGNPGQAGAGVVIADSRGEVLATARKYLGTCTNNEAEYRALILGLEEALRRKFRSLRIHLDSELVVKQLNGEYKVKKSNIRPLVQEARKLLSFIDSYSIMHIMREKNRLADKLANEAIDEEVKSKK